MAKFIPKKNAPEGFGTLRAYAKHRGCALSAVQKAVERGRIARPDSRGWICFAKADAEWTANTRSQYVTPVDAPAPPKAQALKKPKRTAPPPAETPAIIPQTVDEILPDRSNIIHIDADDFAQYSAVGITPIQARKAYFESETKRHDLLEREGKLIPADAAKTYAYTFYRRLRDRLMGIPERLAPELAALADAHEVRRRIRKELESVMVQHDADLAPGIETNAAA